MAVASLAGRPLAASQMVAAVMAIKAARVARGVMTMAGTAGTPPPGPTVADWPTTSHGIARVHPMTAAGPIVAGALMIRDPIAGLRAHPAAAGSAPTATGRSAAAAQISAMTGKAPIGRSAAAGKAAPIGRSAATGQAAAGRAAVARHVAARHRAASGLAAIGLRAAGARLHALAMTGRQAVGEVVLTAAAGQTVQAGRVQAVDRAVQAALALLGERIRAAATAELPESMRTGQSTTTCHWICPTASPRTS